MDKVKTVLRLIQNVSLHQKTKNNKNTNKTQTYMIKTSISGDEQFVEPNMCVCVGVGVGVIINPH